MKKKIIIDTDPGIDDAMAILFAWLSPEIDLLGLTTIFGNVPVEKSTENALILKELMKAPIPVAKGADAPLKKKLTSFPDFVHGDNGFGDIKLDKPESMPVDLDAVDFLIQQILSNPGEITLVPIGPLTNLAMAIEKEPEIISQVKEVVCMGGAILENGNASPAAEANMLSDPDAADIVFTANWPVTLVGLDVTHRILMSDEFLRAVHNPKSLAGDFIYEMCRYYLDFHESIGIEGLYTHDPAAIAYVIDPSLFATRRGEVRVIREGIAIGKTLMNLDGHIYFKNPWSDLPKVNACMEVDAPKVLDLYSSTIAGG